MLNRRIESRSAFPLNPRGIRRVHLTDEKVGSQNSRRDRFNRSPQEIKRQSRSTLDLREFWPLDLTRRDGRFNTCVIESIGHVEPKSVLSDRETVVDQLRIRAPHRVLRSGKLASELSLRR